MNPVRESDVRELHAFVLKGIDDANAGVYRSVDVEISGSAYNPPHPMALRGEMEDYAEWLAEASIPPG